MTVDSEPQEEFRIFRDADGVARAAAELFVDVVRAAFADRGRCSVALSGGSTPRLLFTLLAEPPCRDQVDWPHLDIFWSDERCVPPHDPQSNFRMARETLLDHVHASPERIYRMPAELADLEAAAQSYESRLRQVVPAGPFGEVRLDLIMLGMGDDGHTASLFPETEALKVQDRLVTPNFVPKLNAHRLTFTPQLINAAAHVHFLIAGQDKARALRAVRSGEATTSLYPARLVHPEHGMLHWYADEAAAGG